MRGEYFKSNVRKENRVETTPLKRKSSRGVFKTGKAKKKNISNVSTTGKKKTTRRQSTYVAPEDKTS